MSDLKSDGWTTDLYPEVLVCVDGKFAGSTGRSSVGKSIEIYLGGEYRSLEYHHFLVMDPNNKKINIAYFLDLSSLPQDVARRFIKNQNAPIWLPQSLPPLLRGGSSFAAVNGYREDLFVELD